MQSMANYVFLGALHDYIKKNFMRLSHCIKKLGFFNACD